MPASGIILVQGTFLNNDFISVLDSVLKALPVLSKKASVHLLASAKPDSKYKKGKWNQQNLDI